MIIYPASLLVMKQGISWLLDLLEIMNPYDPYMNGKPINQVNN